MRSKILSVKFSLPTSHSVGPPLINALLRRRSSSPSRNVPRISLSIYATSFTISCCCVIFNCCFARASNISWTVCSMSCCSMVTSPSTGSLFHEATKDDTCLIHTYTLSLQLLRHHLNTAGRVVIVVPGPGTRRTLPFTIVPSIRITALPLRLLIAQHTLSFCLVPVVYKVVLPFRLSATLISHIRHLRCNCQTQNAKTPFKNNEKESRR